MNSFLLPPRWTKILLLVALVLAVPEASHAFAPAATSSSAGASVSLSLGTTFPRLTAVSRATRQRTVSNYKRRRPQKMQERRNPSTVLSALPWSSPLISPADTWGSWMVLLGNAFLGERLSRTSTIGRLLGPPITAMTLTFAMATFGILQTGGTVAATQLQTLALYMATPLVLLGTDFYGCVRRCGPLLTTFGLAALATFVASVVGWLVVGPRLSLALGHSDALKIAAAILARNVGGGLNYMAVCATLQASPTAIAAGLCADNLFGLVYFPAVSYIATGQIDPELTEAAARDERHTRTIRAGYSNTQQNQKQEHLISVQGEPLSNTKIFFNSDAAPMMRQSSTGTGLEPATTTVVHTPTTTTMTAGSAVMTRPEIRKATRTNIIRVDEAANEAVDEVAVTSAVDSTITLDRMTSVLFSASALVWLGRLIGRGRGASLPAATLLTVLFVNRIAPRSWIQSIQPTAELLGTVALYVFFSTLGSQGLAVADSVRASLGPLILFLTFLYGLHGVFLGMLYRLMKQTDTSKLVWLRRSLNVPRILVASSAAIGGPATAVALCQANQWPSLKVPALLVGNLGDAFGTFLGIAFYWVFKAAAGVSLA